MAPKDGQRITEKRKTIRMNTWRRSPHLRGWSPFVFSRSHHDPLQTLYNFYFFSCNKSCFGTFQPDRLSFTSQISILSAVNQKDGAVAYFVRKVEEERTFKNRLSYFLANSIRLRKNAHATAISSSHVVKKKYRVREISPLWYELHWVKAILLILQIINTTPAFVLT